jgi:hypothetical protein
MELLNLTEHLRTIGRASVFYAPKWDGTTSLPAALTHLGDTEGDISLALNEEYSDLRLPELTGPAVHKRYLKGLDPVLSIPLYLADPSLRDILSPIGTGSAGRQRQRKPTEYTLWIVPEELFIDADGEQVAVDYTTAGGWTVDGVAATEEQEDFIAQSIWFWRGHFEFAPIAFRDADAGKAVDTVQFQVMHSDLDLDLIPNGELLFTRGDPADVLIDIDPEVS